MDAKRIIVDDPVACGLRTATLLLVNAWKLGCQKRGAGWSDQPLTSSPEFASFFRLNVTSADWLRLFYVR